MNEVSRKQVRSEIEIRDAIRDIEWVIKPVSTKFNTSTLMLVSIGGGTSVNIRIKCTFADAINATMHPSNNNTKEVCALTFHFVLCICGIYSVYSIYSFHTKKIR